MLPKAHGALYPSHATATVELEGQPHTARGKDVHMWDTPLHPHHCPGCTLTPSTLISLPSHTLTPSLTLTSLFWMDLHTLTPAWPYPHTLILAQDARTITSTRDAPTAPLLSLILTPLPLLAPSSPPPAYRHTLTPGWPAPLFLLTLVQPHPYLDSTFILALSPPSHLCPVLPSLCPVSCI